MRRKAPGYYISQEYRAVDKMKVDLEVFKKGAGDKGTGYGIDSGWGWTLTDTNNIQFAQSEDFLPTKTRAELMALEFLRCCVYDPTYGWVYKV